MTTLRDTQHDLDQVKDGERGMAGHYWFRCSCGKSGSAFASFEAAMDDFRRHVTGERVRIEMVEAFTDGALADRLRTIAAEKRTTFHSLDRRVMLEEAARRLEREAAGSGR